MTRKMIVKMIHGSHLYGLDTPESDVDYKGVFMPGCYEIILGETPKTFSQKTNPGNTKNQAGDVDFECYSLQYFIKLATEGQTVAIDMLHAPRSAWLESSELWESLVANRCLFYTKNMSALIGYARRQAAKYGIKGSRLADVKRAIDFLEGFEGETRLGDLWEDLPEGEHLHKNTPDAKTGLRAYQVCGKKLIETAKISHYLPMLEKFRDDYGARAKAAERSEGVDWKAISHAFRAAYQMQGILLHGDFTYPLPQTDFLLKVKKGEVPYPVAAQNLEDLIDYVEILSRQSNLPKQCNRELWRHQLFHILRKEVLADARRAA